MEYQVTLNGTNANEILGIEFSRTYPSFEEAYEDICKWFGKRNICRKTLMDQGDLTMDQGDLTISVYKIKIEKLESRPVLPDGYFYGYNYIYDSYNNKANIEKWGTWEKALTSLQTLVDCTKCTDCEYCTLCSMCSDCKDCTGLKGNHESIGINVKELAKQYNIKAVPFIHQIVYALASNPEALNMDCWHLCKNTHCRAGWVSVISGNTHLESGMLDAGDIASMVYAASGYTISPERYYDKNKDALKDMKRLADLERNGSL